MRTSLMRTSLVRMTLMGKVVIAAALCLMARALVAQAPSGGLPTETDAHGYKYLVPAPKYLDPKYRATVQKITSDVRLIVQAPTAELNDAVKKAMLDSFYLQYFFPVMTTEDGLKSAATQRSGFLRDLTQTKDQAMHSYLINLAFNTMKQVVQDNGFHPAARYNAMLLISQLNDIEMNTLGATQILPEAMRTALPFIYQQFKSGDSDEVKIAALLGLSRHLEFDNLKANGSATIPANQRAAVIKELIALAETKDSPPTRDPEVHSWMRRRAIEALTTTCQTKPDADIAAAMERILKEESNPVNVRLAVATALGKMSLQGIKIDAVATAKELGYLALATCEAELTRAEAERKADYEHFARLSGTYSGEEYSAGPGGMPGGGRMPGMPGGSGMGGEGGIVRTPLRPTPGSSADGGYGNESGTVNPAETDPKHYQVEFLRRRIRQQLFAVQLGLTGGDDFVEPKTKTGSAPAGGGSSAGGSGSGSNQQSEKKGMHGIAKGDDQEKVKQVYYKVRKLAEIAEQSGESEFYQFVKEMRGAVKNLELVVGKRVPAAGAAAAAAGDDAPAAGKSGKAGPAKGAPKGATPKAPPGKSANRLAPQVFGQPRPGR